MHVTGVTCDKKKINFPNEDCNKEENFSQYFSHFFWLVSKYQGGFLCLFLSNVIEAK